MARVNKGSLLFAALVLIAAAYFGAFIYRTSFVVDGERYFSLFDDAMISMRYASNLANGHGLVWNPGERPVEGFTDPIWTLYMALPHLLPIAPSKRCLFVQMTAALFLLVNLYFVKRIAEDLSDRSVPVSLAAVGLTAFFFPINNWSLQGMEVGLLTLVISIATWATIRSIRTDQFDPVRYRRGCDARRSPFSSSWVWLASIVRWARCRSRA
jgi:arabinofuranosyltransferase